MLIGAPLGPRDNCFVLLLHSSCSTFTRYHCTDSFFITDRALLSDDGGATWYAGGAVPHPKRADWTESNLAELANGSVVLTSRMLEHTDAERSWVRVAFWGPISTSFSPGLTALSRMCVCIRGRRVLPSPRLSPRLSC